MAGWVRVAVIGAVIAAAAGAGRASPRITSAIPVLPPWPSHEVGALVAFGDVEPDRFFAADLDGDRVDELVVDGVPRGGLTVLRWDGGGFRRIARVESAQPRWFCAADWDGDGRDELYGADEANRIVELRLGKRLARRFWPRPTNWLIHGLGIVKPRRGQPLLVLAVTVGQSFESGGDYSSNALLCYRGGKSGWQLVYGQASPDGLSVRFDYGAYRLAGVNELLATSLAGGIDASGQDLYRWTGRGLRRTLHQETGPFRPEGMQQWVGSVFPSGPAVVVSHTAYLVGRSPRYQERDRGEILTWRRGRLRSAYGLPGVPVAVGRFRDPRRVGVLIRTREGYQLLEPSTSGES